MQLFVSSRHSTDLSSLVTTAKHVFVILMMSMAAVSVSAQTGTVPPPVLAAKSWLLIDANTNQVLASEKSNERVEPASLTKLMTAYIVFAAIKEGRLKLEQTVPVSEKAWKAIGSRMFIEPNRPVTVRELIPGMIVQSGNDASIALAEAVAGSEESFVGLMNNQAKRMGLDNTRYTNSTGLPDAQHYTTASDLAALALALIRDFPDQYAVYKQKEYTYNKITQPNRNRLLFIDPAVDGVKTGHTESAGYCLVASALRGQWRLLSVVMGTASDNARAQESLKLLTYGFQNFESLRIYKAGDSIAAAQVWKGKQNEVKIGFAKDVLVTLPKGQSQRIKPVLERKQPLVAPIAQNEQLGIVKLTVDDKVVAQVPAVALSAVQQAGVFGRMIDSIKLMFSGSKSSPAQTK